MSNLIIIIKKEECNLSIFRTVIIMRPNLILDINYLMGSGVITGQPTFNFFAFLLKNAYWHPDNFIFYIIYAIVIKKEFKEL